MQSFCKLAEKHLAAFTCSWVHEHIAFFSLPENNTETPSSLVYWVKSPWRQNWDEGYPNEAAGPFWEGHWWVWGRDPVVREERDWNHHNTLPANTWLHVRRNTALLAVVLECVISDPSCPFCCLTVNLAVCSSRLSFRKQAPKLRRLGSVSFLCHSHESGSVRDLPGARQAEDRSASSHDSEHQ